MSLRAPGTPGLTYVLCTLISPFPLEVFSLASGCSAAFAWIFQQRGMQPHQNRPPSLQLLAVSSPSSSPSPWAGLPAQRGPLAWQCQHPHPALPRHMGHHRVRQIFLSISRNKSKASDVVSSELLTGNGQQEQQSDVPCEPQPARQEHL